MTTLATMKNRIAREIRRPNGELTTEIAEAITTAIGSYEHERWYVNESRENTFTTIINQQNYGVTEAAFIGLITKIDYVFLLIGNTPYELLPKNMKEIESLSTNATFYGQPCEYAYYDEQFWLYPVPPEATWTIRVGAVMKTAAPASDDEVGNSWMTTAERLIRSRAKYELYLHVLKDVEEATVMASSVTEAYDQLSVRTVRLTKTGGGRIRAMPF